MVDDAICTYTERKKRKVCPSLNSKAGRRKYKPGKRNKKLKCELLISHSKITKKVGLVNLKQKT